MFEIDNKMKFINICVIHSSVIRLLTAVDGMKFMHLCLGKFEHCVRVFAVDNRIKYFHVCLMPF